MPGFDRTGPRGMGPLTGGGRGFCMSGRGLRQPFGGNFGIRPRGRGYARAGIWPVYPENMMPDPAAADEDDLESLRRQAQDMKAQMQNLEARIQQMEAKK